MPIIEKIMQGYFILFIVVAIGMIGVFPVHADMTRRLISRDGEVVSYTYQPDDDASADTIGAAFERAGYVEFPDDFVAVVQDVECSIDAKMVVQCFELNSEVGFSKSDDTYTPQHIPGPDGNTLVMFETLPEFLAKIRDAMRMQIPSCKKDGSCPPQQRESIDEILERGNYHASR